MSCPHCRDVSVRTPCVGGGFRIYDLPINPHFGNGDCSMATVVDNGPPLKLKAESGDSLCLLAIEAGFEHCQRLRDANAGKDFVTSRHLEPGDIVVVPERDIKDESKSTDTTST